MLLSKLASEAYSRLLTELFFVNRLEKGGRVKGVFELNARKGESMKLHPLPQDNCLPRPHGVKSYRLDR
jgi:hypothetical protein